MDIITGIHYFSVELNISSLANLLIESKRENQLLPVLSQQYPELDIETVYSVQKAYVQRKLTDDEIAGFKAGLTSEEAQRKFGMTFPVPGVLVLSGERHGSPIIDRSRFKATVIETEIGFLVGEPITHPLNNTSEFYKRIKAVMPVIELPVLGFSDIKKLKGVDIISANLSSAQYIIGREKETAKLNPNNITGTLSLNGQIVN